MLWQRGKPYSQDLRERVFAAADDGAQVCEAAEMLHVSPSYVSKVLERRRTTGETSARPQGGRVLPKLAKLYDAALADLLGTARIVLLPTAPFGGKILYRAQLGNLSADTASAACARLTAEQQPCMIVAPGQAS
jgi:hypothetical protein